MFNLLTHKNVMIVMFSQRLFGQNSTNYSQLRNFVISSHLMRQPGTLVFGLTHISPSLAMSAIPVRLVLSISGILSD